MNLVLLADDAFTFLASWEFMSLASWALVMAHHRERDNARAGYVYIVMASVGTMALLLAFGLLAGPAGGYAFAAIRASGVAPGLAALVLGLALIGAGSKAGLAPLHIWLPLAHPAAPSHVSALMSGVMTKVAVYGFIRIVFDLLGPAAWWWGVPVMVLGAATAVLGVLHALMQTDLKRVLAYSTIENVGLIFAGLGLALAFKANGFVAAAALAATAAVSRAQPCDLQKPAILWRWGGADLDGRARHGAPRRPPQPDAGHWTVRPGRLRRDFRVAATERICFRLAASAIDLAEPAASAMGAENPGARHWRHAGACRGARGGLFRSVFRDRLSRQAAKPGGRGRPRGRSDHNRRYGRSGEPMSARRHSPRLRD
jgi:hypothetical protein